MALAARLQALADNLRAMAAQEVSLLLLMIRDLPVPLDPTALLEHLTALLGENADFVVHALPTPVPASARTGAGGATPAPAQMLGLDSPRALALPAAALAVVISTSWFATSADMDHYVSRIFPFFAAVTACAGSLLILAAQMVGGRRGHRRPEPQAAVPR